jgi:hypothetical protein
MPTHDLPIPKKKRPRCIQPLPLLPPARHPTHAQSPPKSRPHAHHTSIFERASSVFELSGTPFVLRRITRLPQVWTHPEPAFGARTGL